MHTHYVIAQSYLHLPFLLLLILIRRARAARRRK